MKNARVKLGETCCFTTIIGFVFGLLFPLSATILDLILQGLSFTIHDIFLVQKAQPLHWMIDTAPFILGLAGYLVGIKQDKLLYHQATLEENILKRTQELQVKNVKLKEEIEERILIEEKLIQTKEEAIKAKKAEENFLANMSHEIRTPMNGVVGFTRLLLQTSLSDEQMEYVKSIKYSGNHLLAIINDILEISKINAGQISFEEITIPIFDLIHSVANTLRINANNKKLILSTKMDSDLPPNLIGDPVRLSQILINLMNNAIKFTNEGEVSIHVSVINRDINGVHLQFAIKDTGIGIPQDKLSSIFKSFKQADRSTTRKFGGTGLGLSISKRLVELQGGQIWVESKTDEGSTFFFEMSFPIANDVGLEKLSIIEERKPLHNLRVLLAEDHKMNVLLATKVISRWGEDIVIDIAVNGLEAVDLLRVNDYDVVLMDIQMPVMDGFAAIEYIRNKMKKNKRHIPIIALTAEVLPEEKKRAYELGVNEYVTKPFQEEELFSKVSQLTRRKNNHKISPNIKVGTKDFGPIINS